MNANQPIPAKRNGPRVLLICYQCAPEGGSVAMIGWRWFKYLSRECRVRLVTHIRHKHELEPVLDPGAEVTYIDTERFAGPLWRVANRFLSRSQHVLFMVSNIDFLYFGYKVRRFCRTIEADRQFDICHVPTPVSPVAPHRFGKMGLPTVLGPLNGGTAAARGFPEITGAERMWLFRLRGLSRLFTAWSGTYRHADLVYSANETNDRAIPKKWRFKIRNLSENGVDRVADRVPPFPADNRLELLFVGRLVAVKGLTLLIDAMAGLQQPELRLRIVGAGPEEGFLRRRITGHGLDPFVEFLGFLPQAALPDLYRSCHLHVLPSIRESGGASILEAMAQGRPSIALDHGGPRSYITAQSGYLLHCENRDQVVADLRTLLDNLIRDKTDLAPMAAVALEHTRLHFTWSDKIRIALDDYAELIQKQTAPAK